MRLPSEPRLAVTSPSRQSAIELNIFDFNDEKTHSTAEQEQGVMVIIKRFDKEFFDYLKKNYSHLVSNIKERRKNFPPETISKQLKMFEGFKLADYSPIADKEAELLRRAKDIAKEQKFNHLVDIDARLAELEKLKNPKAVEKSPALSKKPKGTSKEAAPTKSNKKQKVAASTTTTTTRTNQNDFAPAINNISFEDTINCSEIIDKIIAFHECSTSKNTPDQVAIEANILSILKGISSQFYDTKLFHTQISKMLETYHQTNQQSLASFKQDFDANLNNQEKLVDYFKVCSALQQNFKKIIPGLEDIKLSHNTTQTYKATSASLVAHFGTITEKKQQALKYSENWDTEAMETDVENGSGYKQK